jgi:hypothetical protein
MKDDAKPEKIRCDACPVMCYIADGTSGACDRYANHAGALVRLDPLTIIQSSRDVVPFMGEGAAEDWDGDILKGTRPFVTAIGAGTTYPDDKPAPFIASQEIEGVDMVTVVTEGIFSYCGVKVKIDTDRHIGHERDFVRVDGEPIGHVMTAEYGSKMLSLGGVEHLTGGTKKEGRVTCDALLRLCNREAVTMVIGEEDHATEVVVDDHITGVLSEHETGKQLGMSPTDIKIKGRRSTPGRYFQVAKPGTGWGGTDIEDPLMILGQFNPKVAWEGLWLFMVATTGEPFSYYERDTDLVPQKKGCAGAAGVFCAIDRGKLRAVGVLGPVHGRGWWMFWTCQPTPLAMCQPLRWSRRLNSPCGFVTMPLWADMWTIYAMSAISTQAARAMSRKIRM